MSELQGRDTALLLDVSSAGSSSRACQIADDFAAHLGLRAGILVDLNAGDLLLSRAVLSKIRRALEQTGAQLGTVYATLPQTQQAALDEGVYVKESLRRDWSPIRHPLPSEAGKPMATPPTHAETTLPETKPPGSQGIELPFTQQAPAVQHGQPPVKEPARSASFDILPGDTLSESSLPGILPAPVEISVPDTALETLYIRQTLRSGQMVRFNGNVVIVGDAHAGSEIVADGDILVWGSLRGIAHAGAGGNDGSEIRAMRIEALQLRIAEFIARRPDRIYYHKDEQDASSIQPETARVEDGEIRIFKRSISRTDRI